MKNEFVPCEEALALKELGFDEECFGFFNLTINKKVMLNNNSYGGFGLTQEHIVLAPLYQQAFRWFREKHNLGHMINGIGHESFIMNTGGMQCIFEPFDFNTYEEAQLACLKKLIEIVKQNKDD